MAGSITYEAAALFVSFAGLVMVLWLFIDKQIKQSEERSLARMDSSLRSIRESEERNISRLDIAISERKLAVAELNRDLNMEVKALQADLKLMTEALTSQNAKVREDMIKEYVSQDHLTRLENRLFDMMRQLTDEMREMRKEWTDIMRRAAAGE